MTHQILFEAEVPVPEDLHSRLTGVICAALEAEGMTAPCEISVLITDDEGIRQINSDQRGIDRATDVLSFPMFDLAPGEHPGAEEADPGTGLVPLGDMVISLERARSPGRSTDTDSIGRSAISPSTRYCTF